MERIYDETLIESCLKQTKFEPEMRALRKNLFIAQYGKGEFLTSPLQEEHLFQIVIRGSLNIYFIRDDGSVYSLTDGGENYLLGEMEIFSRRSVSVYAEASSDLICLALSIEKSRDEMMNNCLFLRMICESLARKMEAVTAIDAAPVSLKQRVLTYMRYKCSGGELKGLQKAAFRLNCSARQLQRILSRHEEEGTVIKTGKGSYRLASDASVSTINCNNITKPPGSR